MSTSGSEKRIWSVVNGVPGSGSKFTIRTQSRRAKMTHKNWKKVINFIFWNAEGCISCIFLFILVIKPLVVVQNLYFTLSVFYTWRSELWHMDKDPGMEPAHWVVVQNLYFTLSVFYTCWAELWHMDRDPGMEPAHWVVVQNLYFTLLGSNPVLLLCKKILYIRVIQRE